MPGVADATVTNSAILEASVVEFTIGFVRVKPGVGVRGAVQAGFSRLGLPQQVRGGIEDTRFRVDRDRLEFAVVWIRDVVRITATGGQQQARKCQYQSERFHR